MEQNSSNFEQLKKKIEAERRKANALTSAIGQWIGTNIIKPIETAAFRWVEKRQNFNPDAIELPLIGNFLQNRYNSHKAREAEIAEAKRKAEVRKLAEGKSERIEQFLQGFNETNKRFADPNIDSKTKFNKNARTNSIKIERDTTDNSMKITAEKTRSTSKAEYNDHNVVVVRGASKKESTNVQTGVKEVNFEIDLDYSSKIGTDISVNFSGIKMVGSSKNGYEIQGLDKENPFHRIYHSEIMELGKAIEFIEPIYNDINTVDINLMPNGMVGQSEYTYNSAQGFSFDSADLA